jgi:hypothetical protein
MIRVSQNAAVSDVVCETAAEFVGVLDPLLGLFAQPAHLELFFATADAPVFWPPSNLLSLIALAQHYGVATRALDWTWSSLTAAYIAVSDASVQAQDHVVVWVFSYLAEMLARIPTSEEVKRRPLAIFTAPGADNDNLQAQRGMFMAHVQRIEDRHAPFEATPYDRFLGEIPSASRSFPTLYRVLVPCAEVPTIRWFLSAAGFTAGRLFPGLWGAAREFSEEHLIAHETAGAPATGFSEELQREITRAFKSRDA